MTTRQREPGDGAPVDRRYGVAPCPLCRTVAVPVTRLLTFRIHRERGAADACPNSGRAVPLLTIVLGGRMVA